jgi:hypothetical protein
MPPSKPIYYRAIVLPFLILVFLLQNQAQADKADKLIVQLTKSADYKVRLSAALNLAKLGDKRPKVVEAFIGALGDSDKTVRGVAAASLAKLIDSNTKDALRKRAVARLKQVASSDSNKFVQRQAQKAYDAISTIGGGGGAGAGGIYVDIGDMSAKAGDSAKMKALMRKTVQKTFAKKASSMRTGSPSRKELGSAEAFHVDGTLTELTEQSRGSSTLVTCKVSMLIATFRYGKGPEPEKSMFGFLNGGATVQAGSSAKDIEYAKEDCVVAVIEDLVAKKVIPTIQTRAP